MPFGRWLGMRTAVYFTNDTAATHNIPSLRQNQQYSGAYGYEPQQSATGAFGFGDGLPSDAQMAERQRRLRE